MSTLKFYKEVDLDNRVADIAKSLIEPFAKQVGVELVDVEYSKMPDGMNLIVSIDKPEGITIDDCEKLHRLIDEPLDKIDVTNGVSYRLCVSSCGLDRPFKTVADYKRNLGKEIEVRLYAPLDKQKKIIGTLKQVDDQGIVISQNNQNISIDFDKIAKSLLSIIF